MFVDKPRAELVFPADPAFLCCATASKVPTCSAWEFGSCVSISVCHSLNLEERLEGGDGAVTLLHAEQEKVMQSRENFTVAFG